MRFHENILDRHIPFVDTIVCYHLRSILLYTVNSRCWDFVSAVSTVAPC